MDIVLERIISLIPQKESGGFVHGAKKTFAQSIGYKGGEIISDWLAGRSDTYLSKVYEISEKYDVDVDWLLGKTDCKKKKPSENGEPKSEYDAKFNEIWGDLTEEQKEAAIAFMRAFKK
jgi:hypothetical protein